MATAGERDRLDRTVGTLFPELSRSRAAALIREGAVSVDGRVVQKPAETVHPGQQVEVVLPEAAPDVAIPQDLPLRIVYEDADLLVINKEAGMVVHPAPGHADGTLVNALLHHVEDLSGIGGVLRPGIVHRLDRGTSGLLVVAKHDRSHHWLSEQFADHSAGRRYLALCLGNPKAEWGTVRTILGRHPTDRLRFASGEKGKPAVTHWQCLQRAGTVSLIECHLETGRTHQVRVHLSEQGWPIIGDPLYGRRSGKLPATLRDRIDPERPLLHAWQLKFRHLDGELRVFEAPLPADFVDALTAVGMTAPLLKEEG